MLRRSEPADRISNWGEEEKQSGLFACWLAGYCTSALFARRTVESVQDQTRQKLAAGATSSLLSLSRPSRHLHNSSSSSSSTAAAAAANVPLLTQIIHQVSARRCAGTWKLRGCKLTVRTEIGQALLQVQDGGRRKNTSILHVVDIGHLFPLSRCLSFE